MKKLIFLILLVLLFTGCSSTQAKENKETTRAMFAWEGVSDKDLPVLERYGINTLYIDVFHFTSVPGYRCYLLVGDPTWGLEEMNDAVKTAKEKGADGIIFDIEGEYEKLADNLERLESSLPVAVCYPYWLDEATEERIIRSSDQSVVMNYFLGKEMEHLQEEMLLSKKYSKELITAYELQPITEEVSKYNTYEGDMAAVLDNYKQFTDVGLAIHWLKYVTSNNP